MKFTLTILFAILSFTTLKAEKKWVLRTEFPDFNYYAELKCTDSLNCFAFVSTYDHSVIYKSIDQGQSWFEFSAFNRNKPIWDSVRSIYQSLVFDSLQMYMNFKNEAVLEKSIDGGRTFKRVYFEELYGTPSVERLYAIAMYDKNLGASITRTNLIYTYDNWDTYTLVPRPDSIYSGSPIFFIDSNNIAVLKFLAKSDEFMRYNIPNDEWSQYNIGEVLLGAEENKCMVDLAIVNDSLIYACGFQFTGVADRAKDLIWKTTNRGKSWKLILEKEHEIGVGSRRIAFKDENHGIAVGNWGKVLETTDGGESWFQHPYQDEMRSGGTEIAWAGEMPLFGSTSSGIFRLETVTEVEELSSDEKFRVYQSGRNLEIAINDPTQNQYSFELYNQTGQRLLTRSVGSGGGFMFEPLELIELSNGAYFYTISSGRGVEFSGKLVVAE